jgi:tetrahydroxynaphthalene reductase
MRLTDLFRRLVSHFIPTRSPETKEAKKQQPSSQSSTSSGTTLFKPPTAITVTTTTSTTMPGVTSNTAASSKYDEIPGPLGLESASLQGKVALVTGAGMPNPSASRFIPCPVLQSLVWACLHREAVLCCA